MKEKLYKYSLFSFILINFWTLYGFFDYYLELQHSTWLQGMSLFFFYFESLTIAIAFGGILLLTRFIYYFISKKNILKSNFLYMFSAIFNLNLLMVTIISILLEMLVLSIDFIPYLLGLVLVTSIIIVDIYRSNFKIESISSS